MKKVLVTGGAGFIGSHLCERLISQGNFVYCLDNLSTGFKNNISHLENHKNFQFIYHDVINPLNMLVDEIYNLASPASPEKYQHDPVYTLKTNVIGAINVLELAHKNKCKILQASTSEIYGDPLEHPQRETYRGNVETTSIRSCYDESKRCAETAFFDFHRNYGVDIRVIRIFNCYGPRMDRFDGRVVSNFINQAIRCDDITIYGDGAQTRSFQYIDDLIDGMMMVMSGDYDKPINVGNPEEFTVLDLAKMIIDKTNSKSNIIFQSLPQDDPKMRKPDISLINTLYGWYPKIPLIEGITRTIGYFSKL